MAGHTLPDATIRAQIKAQIDAESISGWTVYAEYPLESQGYPYLFIGDVFDSLMSNKTSWGNRQTWNIHLWATSTTQIEPAESTVLAALTDGTFTVSGFNLVGMYLAEGKQKFFDPEAVAWHCILPIRIMTTGVNR